ncbi:MAG: acyl carrier protein [Hyphomonadaceae bacterium]|nr:acyl carrier protein [Hyphomonadaceae bacterium]
MTATLEAWFIARVAADADLPPGAVDVDTPLYRYGIDSRQLAFIVEHAETAFGVIADLDRISPAEPIRTLLEALTPASDPPTQAH